MKNLGHTAAQGKPYERHASLEALIRRFCDRDLAVCYASMVYLRRFKMKDALRVDPDDDPIRTYGSNGWIAQPIRCFAEELDMADSQVKVVHQRMVALGIFEVEARKLHPKAIRTTTHVRPTQLFRLFLHKIGFWVIEHAGVVDALVKKVGARLKELMDVRRAHIASIQAMYVASIQAPNGIQEEGTTISTCGSQTAEACGSAVKVEVVHEGKVEAMTEFKGGKSPPTGAFKGGGTSTYMGTLKKPPQSVLEAATSVLNKPPPGSTSKNFKTALWVKVAQTIHEAGVPFPIKGSPTEMARLWKLNLDLIDEYGDPQLLFRVVKETVGGWNAFREWMVQNSSQGWKLPQSFDLMSLQAHRLKAVEYALLEKAPVQSIAEEPLGIPGLTLDV